MKVYGSRSWRKPYLFIWPLLLLSGAQTLPAQQQPIFSSDVEVVNVLATVRNKQGQIIRNLTKDDFILEEDGRRQTIRYFSQETDVPLTVGLLVDTSASQARVLEQERRASYSFLDQMLREDRDLAFVIHFEGEVELLQDLTSSRKELEFALGSLRTPPQDPGGNLPGPWPGPGGGPFPGGGRIAGGTALYDAVFLASDNLMKKQAGRKALIVLSDGVDNASKVSLSTAIEAAQRANTVVYAIQFYDAEAYGGGFGGHRHPVGGWPGGPGWPGGGRRRFPFPAPHPDGKKTLQRISKETGGRFFEVSENQSIDQIYATIQEELRNQYSLGYTSDRADAGAGYRKIRLATKQRELIVYARDGYYPTPQQPQSATKTEQQPKGSG